MKKVNEMNQSPVFSILTYRYKTQDEVAARVGMLGKQPMKPSSHGYEKYGDVPIIEAAAKQAKEFLSPRHKNAAISLMAIVLAANRNYNRQVEPHVSRMRQNWPSLTLAELKCMVAANNFIQFKDIWGHKDQKKYDVLRQMIDVSLSLATQPDWSDYDRMHAWAKEVSIVRSYWQDQKCRYSHFPTFAHQFWHRHCKT